MTSALSFTDGAKKVKNTKSQNISSKVDPEKAENDALYDGYFAIVTSEMDYDAAKIREVYHGLLRIEESFRIMKSDFDA